MVCFGLSLLINPRNPERSDLGAIVNGMGMGIVEFVILGSTKSFVVKIERRKGDLMVGNLNLKRRCFLSPARTGGMLLATVDAVLTILCVLAGIKTELSVELDVEKNSRI